MSNKCFVIQRFDGGRYDSLYEQVFKPAIKAAGFEPYRVDQDPSASIPIETIEKEISGSDACFAELSEDAPNVWFEVGYSIARDKPLCLVCSSSRTKFPFDVQHRQIIRYPEHSVPKDFEELGTRIRQRLSSVAKQDVALQHNMDAAKALSVGPDFSGLKPHELLALTIIFQTELTGEISAWSLKQELERGGYTGVAARLAVIGLKHKGLVIAETSLDGNGDECLYFKVTDAGERWLMDHQDDLNLQIEKRRNYALEPITEDDIPF